METAAMSYVIRREFSPNRAAIVFEFDPQSEAELLRDFPWLGQIGVSAFQNHRGADTGQAAECSPRTRRSRRQRSSAAPYRLWSWMTRVVSLRSSASA